MDIKQIENIRNAVLIRHAPSNEIQIFFAHFQSLKIPSTLKKKILLYFPKYLLFCRNPIKVPKKRHKEG